MVIANPIYDAVFVKLFKDLTTARGFVSALIGEEVTWLTSFTHQDPEEGAPVDNSIHYLAKIAESEDTYRYMLINVHKSKLTEDIPLFRNALAGLYRCIDEFTGEGGEVINTPLQPLSIYFLGSIVDNDAPDLFRTTRTYVNGHNGKKLKKDVTLGEHLSHDSIFVQIPKIEGKSKDTVGEFLSIFTQDHTVESYGHTLEQEYDGENELVKKVFAFLEKIKNNTEVMDVVQQEDQMLRETLCALRGQEQRFIDEIKSKDSTLKVKDQKIKAQSQELKSKDEELESQAAEIEELKKQLAALQDGYVEEAEEEEREEDFETV